MKTLLLITFFAISSMTVVAQNKMEQQVTDAVETLRQAIINADSATLMRITDSHLTYGHSSGKIENQQEFVSALASGRSDFENMDLTEQTVALFGKTAIVRHHLSANVTDSGKKNAVKLGVMLVWQKQNKEWKLIARQATKI